MCTPLLNTHFTTKSRQNHAQFFATPAFRRLSHSVAKEPRRANIAALPSATYFQLTSGRLPARELGVCSAFRIVPAELPWSESSTSTLGLRTRSPGLIVAPGRRFISWPLIVAG